MVLRALPADYAPGDTPTAAEMNGLKDHAGSHVEQLNTVVTKALVTPIATNTTTTISWASVRNNRNGMGWAVGTPSRLPVPAGGDGLWEFSVCAQFDAINSTGFRQIDALKNGTTVLPGLAIPGSNAVFGAINVVWQLDMVAGDYFELRAWQNSGVSINIMVSGISPQVSARRIQN